MVYAAYAKKTSTRWFFSDFMMFIFQPLYIKPQWIIHLNLPRESFNLLVKTIWKYILQFLSLSLLNWQINVAGSLLFLVHINNSCVFNTEHLISEVESWVTYLRLSDTTAWLSVSLYFLQCFFYISGIWYTYYCIIIFSMNEESSNVVKSYQCTVVVFVVYTGKKLRPTVSL